MWAVGGGGGGLVLFFVFYFCMRGVIVGVYAVVFGAVGCSLGVVG